MNILFVWTGVPSYMVACWRELALRTGVNVKLFLEVNRGDELTSDLMLQGLDYNFCYKGEKVQKQSVRDSIIEFKPDIMVVVGWRAEISQFVATDNSFTQYPKLLAFDMIFQWSFRKFMAPLVLHSYLKSFVGAFVPGDRTAFYSKLLGFNSSNIHHGLFSIDTERFKESARKRDQFDDYPRSFAFVGRFAREKRLDILIKAYKIYCVNVRDPWRLNCYGSGVEGACLKGVEGVNDCGYVSPADIDDVYAENGAFVLTSEYDPWPLVIAEAVASGLPVVCTEACGSHADLVRNLYNGMVCGTNDMESIASGMIWVHENVENLPEIGRRGMSLVSPYSKEQWSEHLMHICAQYV